MLERENMGMMGVVEEVDGTTPNADGKRLGPSRLENTLPITADGIYTELRDQHADDIRQADRPGW